MSLGAAIRHYRKRAGLTQEELARRAGMTRLYVGDLERGQDTEQLRKIFSTLKVLGLQLLVAQE